MNIQQLANVFYLKENAQNHITKCGVFSFKGGGNHVVWSKQAWDFCCLMNWSIVGHQTHFMARSQRSIKWNQWTHSVVNGGCYFHVAHTDSFLFWHLRRRAWSNWFIQKQATSLSHDVEAARQGMSMKDMLDRWSSAVSTNSSVANVLLFCSADGLFLAYIVIYNLTVKCYDSKLSENSILLHFN